MPRHPASRPPSPIWARSCASRRSRSPVSIPRRCSAAPRRWPSSCAGPGCSRPSTSARAAIPGTAESRATRRARHPRRPQRPADDPAVRAPRRAAGRRRGALGVAAVRADGARRPPLRPRRRRRQGRHHGAHRRAARADRGGRRRTSTSASCCSSRARRRPGSRSFAQFLSDNADDLRADVIVVADSGNWDAKTPALTVSLRGNTRFTLRVRTLDHASHSGMFGGAVPDAMMATVKLLATLWDEDGAVAVDGTDGAGCRDPAVQRGDAARRGRAARRRQPDRHRHDPQPHLEQAEHHGDRASTRRASRTPRTR